MLVGVSNNIRNAAEKVVLCELLVEAASWFDEFGAFCLSTFHRPVDTLANASRLWSSCMLVLYLISMTTEPIAYFRWYKKAKRTVLEEDCLYLPKDTCLAKNFLFVLLMTVLVCMLLSIPSAGATQGLIFGILYMTALLVIVHTIMRYLKQRKVSAKVNFSVTMVVSIACALVGVLTFGIIKST